MAAGPAVRAIPWKRIFAFAQVVQARFVNDIPKRDRERLRRILASSKGDPRKVTPAERRDVLRILRQLDLQKLGRELAAVGLTAKLLKRGA